MSTTNAGNGQSRENRERKVYVSSGNYKKPYSERKQVSDGSVSSDRRPSYGKKTYTDKKPSYDSRNPYDKTSDKAAAGRYRPSGGRYQPDEANNKKEYQAGNAKNITGEYRGENRANGRGRSNSYDSARYSSQKNYDKGFDFKDKDEDDAKRRPARSSAPAKPKEQQPDKAHISMRLEKEKKAVKRKQDESRKEQRPRQQTRTKRANNVDWTKAYENDSYDDDDFDMYV